MALNFITMGALERHQLISDYLNELIESQPQHPLMALLTSSLDISEGFRLYASTLDDILSGNICDTAQPFLWRHLLLQQGQAVAEVDLIEAQESWRVVALHEGRRAEGMNKAYTLAIHAPETQQQDFEVRFLECPGVHFMALWLHHADPLKDLWMAVAPDHTQLQKYSFVTEAEVVSALTPQAQAIKDFLLVPGNENTGG